MPSHITIKLNGFLINFNGWAYDKKLGSHFACLFLRRREQFFFRRRGKLISTFRSAFGLCFEVMNERSFAKLLKTSDPENVFRNTFTVEGGGKK